MKKLTNKQAIASAKVFAGPYFENLALMCGLRYINSWKTWQDDYGYQIKILKNRSLKVSKCDEPNFVSDIYAKSSPEIIANNSYWCCFFENNKEKIFFFVGNDGRLRVFSVSNSKAQTYPPLFFGVQILKFICENYTNDFGIINKIELMEFCTSFNVEVGYITSWPPENEAIKYIEETIGQR